MRSLMLSGLALAGVLGFAAPAAADERSDAIALCRAEVIRQTGAEDGQLRLDQTRTRGRAVHVDLDLWRDGQLTNVRCSVQGGAEGQVIASINPALQTATASAQ